MALTFIKLKYSENVSEPHTGIEPATFIWLDAHDINIDLLRLTEIYSIFASSQSYSTGMYV